VSEQLRGEKMPTHRPIARIFSGLATLGAIDAAYLLVIRPWLVKWGATETELRRAMPGDDQVVDPVLASTRGVTIDAGPEEIWPWLVQIGHQRGGLYSYDRLDQLFGILDRPSADRILPQFQHLEVGDVIPMGRGPSWRVSVVERGHALVVAPVEDQVSWAFVLYPADGASTRLVSRVRVRMGWPPLMKCLSVAVDIPWFLMERRMLLGIKARAETKAAW
jgi:hypothetical protein